MVSGQPDVSELRLFGAQGIGASRDTRNRAVAPTAGFPRVFGGRGKDWGRRPQAWGLGVGRRPARGSGLVRRSAPLPARGWGGASGAAGPTLRCAARWRNGKVWAAVRGGGGRGKLAARV